MIHSRITCPSGYMFGRNEFACRSFRLCIKWIVIAARQRWRWRLSSRGLTGHCRGPTRAARDSPGPRSGSRPGPAPVEKHETGPISYLIVTSTERASRQRSSRVAASSLLLSHLVHNTANTCAYPIVRLYVSYSNVRSRKNVMVQLHAPQGSRVVEN